MAGPPKRKRTSRDADLPESDNDSKRSKSSPEPGAEDEDTGSKPQAIKKQITGRIRGAGGKFVKKTTAEKGSATQKAEQLAPASKKGKGEKPILNLTEKPTPSKKPAPSKKPSGPKTADESGDTPYDAGTTKPTSAKKYGTRYSDRIARLNTEEEEDDAEASQDGSAGAADSVRTTQGIHDFYTGGKRSKRYFDKLSNKDIDVNDYIKIKQVKGRGRGVFAKRPIPAGTLLLQERTLLDRVPVSDGEVNERLRKQVSALPENDKYKFLLLCHEPNKDTEESRVKSNAFSLEKEGKSYSVWFCISMLNHSCLPNAHIAFVDFDGQDGYNLRARVDIDTDEEILLNYKPDWESDDNKPRKQAPMPVTQRKQEIKEQWGFSCLCPLCRNGTAIRKTDKDYAELHYLRSQVLKFKKDHLPDQEKRDHYNSNLSKYVKLLKEYHHIPTINKNTKEAARFMAAAPPEDDLANSWTAKWQAEALAVGIAENGIESVGKTEGLGEGFKKPKSGSTELPRIAKRILGSLEKPFTTPVGPRELEFGDLDDDDDDHDADDWDGPTLYEDNDAEQEGDDYDDDDDEEQGKKKTQSSKPSDGKTDKDSKQAPKPPGEEPSDDDDDAPDDDAPADDAPADAPPANAGSNGKKTLTEKPAKPGPKKAAKSPKKKPAKPPTKKSANPASKKGKKGGKGRR